MSRDKSEGNDKLIVSDRLNPYDLSRANHTTNQVALNCGFGWLFEYVSTESMLWHNVVCSYGDQPFP